MNPRYRLLLRLLLLFGPVIASKLADETACTLDPYDSNPSISDNMVFGIETIAARLGHNVVTPPVYRLPQVPVDVDGYPIAPKGLKLEQVHVYVRHGEHCFSLLTFTTTSSALLGERTPVGIRLSQPPASIPEHWMMCTTARQFQAAVLGPNGKREFIRTEIKVERVDGNASDSEWSVVS
jgi:acid phosphatase